MLWSAREWARVKANGDENVQLVHDATNNEEKWGPTGEQMEEVCRNFATGHTSIMKEIRWRLDHRDNAWRPCYKSLVLLDYLARNVKENLLPHICTITPLLRTIASSFYYTNSKGEDHGLSVREQAKNLAELLMDGALLREEREKALLTKRKLAGGGMGATSLGGYRSGGGGMGGRGRSYGGASHGQSYSGGSANAFRSPNTRVPRTREEQEQMDLEYAMRMQLEEERRTGVSAQQLEDMYARRVQNRQRQQQQQQSSQYRQPAPASPAETDEQCAARLQREEEERARAQGLSLPTLRSDREEQQQKQQQPPPAPAEPPKPSVGLDDLFAPAPAAPPQQSAPFDPFGAPPAPAAPQYADPFGAPQPQQQQANPWGAAPQAQQQAQQQTNPWGAAPQAQQQPPQQANTWMASAPSDSFTGLVSSQPPPQPQQQANPWGGAVPSAPQTGATPDPFGAPQQPQTNPWGAAPQAQQQAQQQTNPWGAAPQAQQQPPQQANTWMASAPSDSFAGLVSSQPPPQPQQQANPWGGAVPSAPQTGATPDPFGAPQQPQTNPWGAPAVPPGNSAPAPAAQPSGANQITTKKEDLTHTAPHKLGKSGGVGVRCTPTRLIQRRRSNNRSIKQPTGLVWLCPVVIGFSLVFPFFFFRVFPYFTSSMFFRALNFCPLLPFARSSGVCETSNTWTFFFSFLVVKWHRERGETKKNKEKVKEGLLSIWQTLSRDSRMPFHHCKTSATGLLAPRPSLSRPTMLRRSLALRGHATSNLFAPPFSGRWFNPPHQWTMSDTFVPAFFLGFSPMGILVYLYHAGYMPHFSHFQDQHYYPAQVYTKEFISQYNRLERWRCYSLLLLHPVSLEGLVESDCRWLEALFIPAGMAMMMANYGVYSLLFSFLPLTETITITGRHNTLKKKEKEKEKEKERIADEKIAPHKKQKNKKTKKNCSEGTQVDIHGLFLYRKGLPFLLPSSLEGPPFVLECVSTGDTCRECQDFDFLPTRCPRCGGVFCWRHALQHHIPPEPLSATGSSSGGTAWCELAGVSASVAAAEDMSAPMIDEDEEMEEEEWNDDEPGMHEDPAATPGGCRRNLRVAGPEPGATHTAGGEGKGDSGRPIMDQNLVSPGTADDPAATRRRPAVPPIPETNTTTTDSPAAASKKSKRRTHSTVWAASTMALRRNGLPPPGVTRAQPQLTVFRPPTASTAYSVPTAGPSSSSFSVGQSTRKSYTMLHAPVLLAAPAYHHRTARPDRQQKEEEAEAAFAFSICTWEAASSLSVGQAVERCVNNFWADEREGPHVGALYRVEVQTPQLHDEDEEEEREGRRWKGEETPGGGGRHSRSIEEEGRVVTEKGPTAAEPRKGGWWASARQPRLVLTRLGNGQLLREALSSGDASAATLLYVEQRTTRPVPVGALEGLPVLPIEGTTTTTSTAPLAAALSAVLFEKERSPTAGGRHIASYSVAGKKELGRDSRVRAIRVWLLLRSRELLLRARTGTPRAAAAAVVDEEGPNGTSNKKHEQEEEKAPTERDGGGAKTAGDAPQQTRLGGPAQQGGGVPVSPWPFQCPPPLHAMPFQTPKLKPLRCEGLPAKPGAATTIALFVEDIDLNRPVPPLCVAVSAAWNNAKLCQLLKEVLVSQMRLQAAQLQHYELFRLPRWRRERTEITMEDVACLTATPAAKTQVAGLQSGDSLFLGLPDGYPRGEWPLLTPSRWCGAAPGTAASGVGSHAGAAGAGESSAAEERDGKVSRHVAKKKTTTTTTTIKKKRTEKQQQQQQQQQQPPPPPPPTTYIILHPNIAVMSELVSNAEAQLHACVAQMLELLRTVHDALPQSSFDIAELEPPSSSSSAPRDREREASGSPPVPDTLLQRLEWERAAERQRIAGPAQSLQRHMQRLRTALGTGAVVDVPLEVLDRDIATLSAENIRVGDLLLRKYAEAEDLASSIEQRMLEVPLPGCL
eukprot:gene3791-2681_t